MKDDLDSLLGQILVSANAPDDALYLTTDKGDVYQFSHNQDCCESVTIDDIVGDLADLVGAPILIASEGTNVPSGPQDEGRPGESFTWTFYNFATVKGYVTVKWYGTSNGYYSERVDLRITRREKVEA